MPRSPKGRAVARGLDAHLHLQHAFMPAGYASLKIAQVNQKCRLTVITVSTATVPHCGNARFWPNASDIAVRAIVGFQKNCGSASRFALKRRR
jgi:hypothetical protein